MADVDKPEFVLPAYSSNMIRDTFCSIRAPTRIFHWKRHVTLQAGRDIAIFPGKLRKRAISLGAYEDRMERSESRRERWQLMLLTGAIPCRLNGLTEATPIQTIVRKKFRPPKSAFDYTNDHLFRAWDQIWETPPR